MYISFSLDQFFSIFLTFMSLALLKITAQFPCRTHVSGDCLLFLVVRAGRMSLSVHLRCNAAFSVHPSETQNCDMSHCGRAPLWLFPLTGDVSLLFSPGLTAEDFARSYFETT